MVRYSLLESCRLDDKYLLSVRDDLERKLTEEGDFYLERVMLRYWVESLVRYVRWYEEACCDFTLPLEQLIKQDNGSLVSRRLRRSVLLTERMKDNGKANKV